MQYNLGRLLIILGVIGLAAVGGVGTEQEHVWVPWSVRVISISLLVFGLSSFAAGIMQEVATERRRDHPEKGRQGPA
jgi:hypothetical protein